MKAIRCRDAGFDCAEEICAESEEEVLDLAADHFLTAHQVQLTLDMIAALKILIRNKA